MATYARFRVFYPISCTKWVFGQLKTILKNNILRSLYRSQSAWILG